MTDITIPAAAVSALQKYIRERVSTWLTDDEARAACLAMLENWPEVVHYRGGWEPVIHNNRKQHLILPLTAQEKTDDKA